MHYILCFCFVASSYTSLIINQGEIFKLAVGTTFTSYIFGFFFYLLIDKPIRNIDRMILFPQKKSESFLAKKKNPKRLKFKKDQKGESVNGPKQSILYDRLGNNGENNNLADL